MSKHKNYAIKIFLTALAPFAMLGVINVPPAEANHHGRWVTAPSVEPGFTEVGVDAKGLRHHQIKVFKRKGKRVKVEWLVTIFEKKPWRVIPITYQFECKKNKARSLDVDGEWEKWEPIKSGTFLEDGRKIACLEDW